MANKITIVLLVLALFAMPFLNAIEAAGRAIPPSSSSVKEDDDHKNDNNNKKLYGDSKFLWGLWPFGLFHPWLVAPWWLLKDAKTTTTTTITPSNDKVVPKVASMP